MNTPHLDKYQRLLGENRPAAEVYYTLHERVIAAEQRTAEGRTLDADRAVLAPAQEKAAAASRVAQERGGPAAATRGFLHSGSALYDVTVEKG
jgi:hypothetical protein